MQIKSVKGFAYKKTEFEKIFSKSFKSVFKKGEISGVCISLLDSKKKNFLKKFIFKQAGFMPLFAGINLKLPVKINYSAGLGNDRICNAVAAVRLFDNKNILVVDFGTASTYTMISNTTITGGMISPGIKTSLDSLTEKTTLPKVELSFPERMFNNNTTENISAGVLFQSLFSTERIISEVKKKYKDLLVVATGGLSELISEKTNLINVTDKNLVLKGINFILNENTD